MRARRATAAIGVACALALAATGCGDDAPADGTGTRQRAVVDSALRGVLAKAPAEARVGVRYVGSDPRLPVPRPAKGTTAQVVAAPTFPAWTAEDGVRVVRAVATDEVVLLRAADAPESLRGLPRRGLIRRVGGGTAGVATSEAFRRLAERRPTQGGRGLRSDETRSTAEAAASVASGAADGALVMRSTVGRVPDGTRVVGVGTAVAAPLVFQLGTVGAGSERGPLASWLTGPEGAAALRAAGYGAPDPTQAAGQRP